MDQDSQPPTRLPNAFALFKPSFEALMLNVWTFVALAFLPLAIAAVGIMIALGGQSAGGDSAVLALAPLAILAALVISIITAPALPYLQLKSVRHETVTLGEAMHMGLKNFWRFYGLSLMVGLVTFAGFLLLIVPGLIMIRRYMLAAFYMYDQNLGIGDAMKKSADESKPYSMALWGIVGVNFLIGVPGMFIVLLPASMVLQFAYSCAPAVRYLQIKQAFKSTTNPEALASSSRSDDTPIV